MAYEGDFIECGVHHGELLGEWEATMTAGGLSNTSEKQTNALAVKALHITKLISIKSKLDPRIVRFDID